MLNINESLEQRIDQLKGQRDLSILLTKSGLENDLKSQQLEANSTSQKLISLLNNTELSWDDKLIVKMRELDDAMREASESRVVNLALTCLFISVHGNTKSKIASRSNHLPGSIHCHYHHLIKSIRSVYDDAS